MEEMARPGPLQRILIENSCVGGGPKQRSPLRNCHTTTTTGSSSEKHHQNCFTNTTGGNKENLLGVCKIIVMYFHSLVDF